MRGFVEFGNDSAIFLRKVRRFVRSIRGMASRSIDRKAFEKR
jgi:hypothetical protein